jgi:LysM repeat protein
MHQTDFLLSSSRNSKGASSMKKKRPVFLVVLFLSLAIGLAACVRSAATPMPETGEQQAPADATEDAMAVLAEHGTQTAIAATGEVATAEATEAPKPTATPEPQEEGEPEPEEEQEPQEEAGEEEQEPPPAVKEEYPVPDTYTLNPGEFPYCIARRFDIAPSALLNANNLSRSSVVYPGTTLTIPKNAPDFNEGPRALRQHPTTYTVRGGDTIYSIACLFGDVFPQAIADANGLKGAYTLNVGQTIKIP